MKKNRYIVGILLILAVFLVGCNSEPEVVSAQNEEKKIEIIATTFPQYDFIKNIVGDRATVTLLLTPGMETHSFEPSPKDIIDISKSDLFVYTGGESWIDGLNEAVDTETVTFVSLMEIVTLLEEEMVEGMEHGHDEHGHDDHDHDHESEEHAHEEDHDHDHESEEHAHEEDHDHDHESEEHAHEEDHDHDHESEEHAHEEDHDHDHESEEHAHEEDHDHESEEHAHEGESHAYDEHVWLSPENAIEIVRHLEHVISEKDEKNKDFYSTNAENYIEKLNALDALFEEVTQNAETKNIIVADRFPFRYLTESYGLNYHAAFSGCSTQTDASSATVAFLIDTVKEEQSTVVFYTEQSNQVLADTIVEATGAQKKLLHSCHNITKEEIEAGVSYLTLMTQNAEQLGEALK